MVFRIITKGFAVRQILPVFTHYHGGKITGNVQSLWI